MADSGWPAGPLVLGVGWKFSPHLIHTAAELAAALGQHLVCAFVDPAGYLTEWDPETSRDAHSLDPATNEEAEYPADELLHRLEALLGPPGKQWSFRVLNGDVRKALCRLAEHAGASFIIVGAGRPGPLARMDRFLGGSVSTALTHKPQRPVLIVPDEK